MKRVKLYEQIVDEIKRRIEAGAYRKGDLLPSENDFIDEFGVSRTTVREALRVLGEAGVIRTKQGRGSVVVMEAADFCEAATECKKDYKEHFAKTSKVRLLLEPEVARMVALEASEAAKRRIDQCVKELGRGKKSSGTSEDFHRTIFEATENPFLLQTYEMLLQVENNPPITSLVAPYKQRSVMAHLEEQHQKINEAIQNSEGEFAYFYMKEHACYIEQVYNEYFSHFYS